MVTVAPDLCYFREGQGKWHAGLLSSDVGFCGKSIKGRRHPVLPAVLVPQEFTCRKCWSCLNEHLHSPEDA